MIKLLKYRAALLTVMFGLFGGAISKLLVIDEMTGYYTALASIIALVVNLLVSFLLKGRWNTRLKNNIKIICFALFIALVGFLYMHTKYFIENTFPYSDFENNVSYHVKGSEYTLAAKKFKAEHQYIESDADLVREGFGSPEEKGKVWTQESIDKNWLRLVLSYSLIVIFFVGLVSVLIEVLISQYGKSTEKLLEPI